MGVKQIFSIDLKSMPKKRSNFVDSLSEIASFLAMTTLWI